MEDHAELAARYLKAGWHPLWLPARAKWPPPEGHTGYTGRDLEAREIPLIQWTGNVGLRMPPDVIGLDLDVYRGGLETFVELRDRLGTLPRTYSSRSGREDGSGIYFFLVPAGFVWTTSLPGIDIIQRNHRYAVVWPSIHPEGREYQWHGLDGELADLLHDVPYVDQLPELPDTWIQALSRLGDPLVDGSIESRAFAVDQPTFSAFQAAHTRQDDPTYVRRSIRALFEREVAEGRSRHDSMQHCLIWAMEASRAGLCDAREAIGLLAAAWHLVHDDPRRREIQSPSRTTEFTAMCLHAVGKAESKAQAEMDRLHDEVAGIPIGGGIKDLPPEPAVEPSRPSVFVDWSTTVELAEPWLVEHFWPVGRAIALWASAKEGKSELALWVATHLSMGVEPWTGKPTTPLDVVYLDWEMTRNDLFERLDEFGIDPARLERLHYAISPAMYALDEKTGGEQVAELVEQVGAQAVVIDTFGRAVIGDENDADTVRAFYRHTGQRLKAMGVAYLRTDHAGKDQARGQRGSSAKRDDVDVVWRLRRTQAGVVLNCEHGSRLSWVGPELVLDRDDSNGVLAYRLPVGIGPSSVPTSVRDKIAELDAIGAPDDVTRREAIRLLGLAGKTPGKTATLGAALQSRRARKPKGTTP
jgi:hypothetical protein